MKIIEEKYLKKSISKLNKFVKEHRDFLDFFNTCDEMMNTPLQDLSFKSDLNFFDEISFILSVITSIISHPHLVNKGEEIVVRAELAPHVSSDMFLKTIKDPQLWSEDGLDMIPEYVYHYQQTDELKIYENIFIIKLINMIEQELVKYNDFYFSTIQTFEGQDNLSIKRDHSDIALKRMQYLNKRIKHIKNTYFYKVVSKANTRLINVHPTNILLKDRLYNHCFKFYKKLITYTDRSSRLYDIRLYYFVQLVKVCKEKGYSLYQDDISIIKFEDNRIIIPHIVLQSELFELIIYPDNANIGLVVEVINNNVKGKKARKSKHLLLFNDQTIFNDIEYECIDSYMTVEVMSLWNMAIVDDDRKSVYANPLTEKELISKWLESKLYQTIASKDIYTAYCPSCRSQNIEDENGLIVCKKCSSIYTFFKSLDNKMDNIWFLKLRR